MRSWSDAFMAIVIIVVGVLVATLYFRDEVPAPEPSPIPSPAPVSIPATSQTLTIETRSYIDETVEAAVENRFQVALEGLVSQAVAAAMESHLANVRQLYRDVQQLVAFGMRIERAVDAGARELRSDRLRLEHEIELEEERPAWSPPERQVILYFYPSHESSARSMHAQAVQLIREGHTVYRVPVDRRDLSQQYSVRNRPKWLVIRDRRLIYRSQQAPRFPRPQPQPSPAPVTAPRTTPSQSFYHQPYSSPRGSAGFSGIQCIGCQ